MSKMMSLINLRYIQNHTPEQYCEGNSKNEIRIMLGECIQHMEALKDLYSEFENKGLIEMYSAFVHEFQEEYKLIEQWEKYLLGFFQTDNVA